jgi:LacI family transcriptional regulator
VTVTIKDVAREAGFSVATVSRVLNNSGPVRDETRRRIEEVAGRLHYTPNVAARSLITRKTLTIGVLLPDLYGEFFSEVIRGIDRAARNGGYHLLVSGSHNDREEIEAAVHAMHGRVDGLIVMSPGLEPRAIVAGLPRRLPLVLLNCDLEENGFDAVNVDNYGGAREMVHHLLGLGHRRVAIIAGARDNSDARERLRGYRDAITEADADVSVKLLVEGDFTEFSGFKAARQLLALSPRPTAIFACNDSMAIGALSALREEGVRVPNEIAVAGFDDIPIARYVSPPLSSVHVPIRRLGVRAVERLLLAMSDATEKAREVLPTRLVVRESCGGGTVAAHNAASAEARRIGGMHNPEEVVKT